MSVIPTQPQLAPSDMPHIPRWLVELREVERKARVGLATDEVRRRHVGAFERLAAGDMAERAAEVQEVIRRARADRDKVEGAMRREWAELAKQVAAGLPDDE